MFAIVAAATLPKSEIHTAKEASADERDFVDDEEDDSTPLFFKAPCGVAFKLLLRSARCRSLSSMFSLRSQC